MVHNTSNNKPFNVAFRDIRPNLEKRYAIRREMDCLNEFIQFVDNTRNLDLQSLIYEEIMELNSTILNYITNYENRNKEDVD